MMRDEGAVNNSSGIQLGVMTGPKSCRIGNLALTEQDLCFLDKSISAVASKVSGHCPADGELKDKSAYLPALAAGDTVALYRLSDSKYLVIGKVVDG